MTIDVKQMIIEELQEQLGVLEDSYAEALKDNASPETLQFIWIRIRELRAEVDQRKQP